VLEGVSSTPTGKKPVQFHVVCFYLWDHERREPSRSANAEGSGVAIVACSPERVPRRALDRVPGCAYTTRVSDP
jgi:hypothetical protein